MSEVDASEDYVVKLPTGEARVMSIEEIDAAFEAGRIDRWTPILAPDASGWSDLAKLADLGAEVEEEAHSTASREEPNSIAPTAFHLDEDLEQAGLPRPQRGRRIAFGLAMACVLAGALGLGARALRDARRSSGASWGAVAAAARPPADAPVAAPVPASPPIPVAAATQDPVPAASAPSSSSASVKVAPKAKPARGRKK